MLQFVNVMKQLQRWKGFFALLGGAFPPFQFTVCLIKQLDVIAFWPLGVLAYKS